MPTITTGQLAIIASAVLLLAAGFLAAIWNGVVVITASIKVVPPWQRKAPEKKKQVTKASAAPAAGESPAGAVGPRPVEERAA
jgi:hypothetical protein